MVTTLGTELGTILGTELGSLKDVYGFDTRLLYALSGFSAANFYQTALDGGEAGVASGFLTAALARLDFISTVSGIITERAAVGSQSGHVMNTGSASLNVSLASSAPAYVNTAYTVTASDVGKLFLIIGVHTGTQVQLWTQRRLSASAAITGYNPAAGVRTTLGVRGAGSLPATAVSIVATMTARGVPSQTQIEALFDTVRNTGRLPASFAGATITHHWPVRDELAKAGVPVLDGQLAPASLPDTVTEAAIDRMDRQGSPTVKIIDPSIDGRKSYGALGFSASASLDSAPGASITGVGTGFWVAVTLRPDVIPAGAQMIAGTANASAANGWALQFVPQIRFAVGRTAGGSLQSSLYTVVAADVLQPMHVLVHLTGSAVRLYVNGVQVGVDTAFSGTYAPDPGAMQIGRNGATQALTQASVFAIAGGHANPTLAEIQQNYADFVRTGRLQPIGGKTDHSYDLTADVIANGGPENGIPLQVLDRIGTDHLTRVGGLRVDTGSTISGFSNVGDYLQTLIGQGIVGAAGGFWVSVGVAFTTLTGAQMPAHCNTFGSGDRGWAIQANGASLQFYVVNDAGVATFAATYTLTGADLNVPMCITGQLSASGQMRLFVNGVQVGADVAMVGTYGPSAVTPTRLGLWATSRAFLGRHYGLQGGHTDVTAAEVLTAAQAFQSAGQLVAIPGKTHKQWSLPLDVAAAGGKMPQVIQERIAGAEPMRVATTALQVAQRAERLWSYESTPIFRGGSAWSSTAYYQAAPGVALGHNTGFWAAWFGVFPSGAGSATREFVSALGNLGGWDMRITGAMTALSWRMYDLTPNGVTYTNTVVNAADLDKLQMYVIVWDGPGLRQRAYWKRAEVGTGTTRSGYVPSSTDTLRIGGVREEGFPGDVVQTYGFAYGLGVPTLAQVQALYDGVMANERMVGIPGITDNLYNLTQDFAGGATTATIADRQGSATLTRAGTPTYSERFARAFGW